MTRRCRLCGRVLRDPLWRARGVGRYCARRAGLVRSRQCVTVLVWSARAAEPGEGQMALFEFGEAGKGAARPL
jgi:hypothetical protein